MISNSWENGRRRIWVGLFALYRLLWWIQWTCHLWRYGKGSRFRKHGRPLRIGLSMGTFNPIHLWHLQVAQCVWRLLGLDFILFIPNGDPPHDKPGVVSRWIRYMMVRAGIHGNRAFKSSPIEIFRSGKSYTVDTLRALKELYGDDVELYLIIGLDNVDTINKWFQAPEIFKLCKLAIAPRNSQECTRAAISAVLPPEAQFEIIDSPDSDVSSTKIREWIKKGLSECAAYLVPNRVRKIINRFKLYVE